MTEHDELPAIPVVDWDEDMPDDLRVTLTRQAEQRLDDQAARLAVLRANAAAMAAVERVLARSLDAQRRARVLDVRCLNRGRCSLLSVYRVRDGLVVARGPGNVSRVALRNGSERESGAEGAFWLTRIEPYAAPPVVDVWGCRCRRGTRQLDRAHLLAAAEDPAQHRIPENAVRVSQ